MIFSLIKIWAKWGWHWNLNLYRSFDMVTTIMTYQTLWCILCLMYCWTSVYNTYLLYQRSVGLDFVIFVWHQSTYLCSNVSKKIVVRHQILTSVCVCICHIRMLHSVGFAANHLKQKLFLRTCWLTIVKYINSAYWIQYSYLKHIT